MATIFVTEQDIEEFDSEQPTEPDAIMLLTVEEQVNGATSVRQMAARVVKPHWTETLSRQLDSAPINNDRGPGWAGRVAR